jgi:hypothetical protein
VWSEEDRRPPWNGEVELVDSESGSRVKMQIDERARERYTAAFDQYAEKLQKIAVSNNGRYVSVSTATPLEDVIFGTISSCFSVGVRCSMPPRRLEREELRARY